MTHLVARAPFFDHAFLDLALSISPAPPRELVSVYPDAAPAVSSIFQRYPLAKDDVPNILAYRSRQKKVVVANQYRACDL